MSNYYTMPGDVEVIEISRHLTGNGAQALQYIARSCRLDGNNKGDRKSDLRKALYFIADELHRLEQED